MTGSSFHQRATTAKPHGLPLASKGSQSAFNSRRIGNADAKEDKQTAVITVDDLQRLREQCGIGGAKTEMETEAEWKAKDRKDMYDRSRQRIKNWPNTIENMRHKRIEEKYRKLEEAEVSSVCVS